MNSGRQSVGTIEDLHTSAEKITGLDDFGSDDYREGLAVLLESYARDAALTPQGNKTNRAALRGALVARQLSEAAWRKYPEHGDIPVESPIFVTGLPRTGTTALHRLLCADPRNQGLEMWLTECPQPRPPRETWDNDPVFHRIQEGFRQYHADNPEFAGVHYMSADTVEECWQLLRQSMMSVSFESLAHLPTYSRWLAAQDWTEAYRRHRKNLQLIGLPDAGNRWVLKNPSHLFALDALRTVYPDALIVQTHRDPRAVIASSSSLSRNATEGSSTVFRDSVIGRDQLELWSRGARRFMDDRARYDQARFADVRYEDLVADPLGTVEAVYDHFGLTLTDDARAAMVTANSESTGAGRQPAHSYALSEFGVTGDAVDEYFRDYIRAHRQGDSS